MISVENFYWILYQNLMQPVGLDAWYFHPFGTMDNLSISEFPREPAHEFNPYVLFHFDQEPIFPNQSWNDYDQWSHQKWSGKVLKILANSEHSEIKKHVCEQHSMLDWYYFYHGFAALDWFRDGQFLDEIQDFTKSFCSFNHLVKNKSSYRMGLTAQLLHLGVDPRGLISFHGTESDCREEIEQRHSLLPEYHKRLIEKHLCSGATLPWTVDSKVINGNFSAHLGHQEYKLWQSFFLHLVNETIFYGSKLHLTEKVFKPIVALRPFILTAAPGNLKYLRTYGFKTFEPWINESYDEILDPAQRLNLIAYEVAKFYSKSLVELRQIYEEMRPILLHNKRHFFGEFRRTITNELVDNFDTCVRIWNNGRVDGRKIPSHPDIRCVKEALLR